jgi:hypothetical protein
MSFVKRAIPAIVSVFIIGTFLKLVVDSYWPQDSKQPTTAKSSDSYYWKAQWDSSNLGKVTIHIYDPALRNGHKAYLNEFMRNDQQSRCYVGTYTVVSNLKTDWQLRGSKPKKSKLREYASHTAQDIYTEATAAFNETIPNCENWMHL